MANANARARPPAGNACRMRGLLGITPRSSLFDARARQRLETSSSRARNICAGRRVVPVADAVDGLDEARLLAIVADLLPEPRHVHVDRARRRVAVVAPHL